MNDMLDPDLEPFIKNICSLYINLKAHGHLGKELNYFDDVDTMNESCHLSFSVNKETIDVSITFKEDLIKQDKIRILKQIIDNLQEELLEIVYDSTPATIH